MLSALFVQCNHLLYQNRHFWQRQPFYNSASTLCTDLPDTLYTALTALSQETFRRLSENREDSHQWLGDWVPCLPELLKLEQSIPLLTAETCTQAVDNTYSALAIGVPGRKWQQIVHFSRALQFTETAEKITQSTKAPVLEWCAGKGYLGRLISIQHQQPVLSLEWQRTLCQQGETWVNQQRRQFPALQQQFQQGDALSPEARLLLESSQAVVALHACGDLHTQLIKHCMYQLQHASTSKQHNFLQQVAIAPCCYHLTTDEYYQPLSSIGQSSDLQLSRQDLKIPLQETVTGGQRIERLRDRELHWRLSFDSLRQQITGQSGYQPLPGFKKQLLSGAFTDFVHWAVLNRQLADTAQLKKNSPWRDEKNLQRALSLGEERLLWVRKLEWLQSIFRRPLELWLVLDRALALEDAGFHVELYQFCEKSVSPRNLLILAKRKASLK